MSKLELLTVPLIKLKFRLSPLPIMITSSSLSLIIALCYPKVHFLILKARVHFIIEFINVWNIGKEVSNFLTCFLIHMKSLMRCSFNIISSQMKMSILSITNLWLNPNIIFIVFYNFRIAIKIRILCNIKLPNKVFLDLVLLSFFLGWHLFFIIFFIGCSRSHISS